jgi:hypothetical protein
VERRTWNASGVAFRAAAVTIVDMADDLRTLLEGSIGVARLEAAAAALEDCAPAEAARLRHEAARRRFAVASLARVLRTGEREAC